MPPPAPSPRIPMCLHCAPSRPGYKQSHPRDVVHVMEYSHLRCNFCNAMVLDPPGYAALPDNAKMSLLPPSAPGPPLSAPLIPSCKTCVNRPRYAENGPQDVVHVVGGDHLVCNFCGGMVLDREGYAALPDVAKRPLRTIRFAPSV
jgi:hypothetical protein